jgi:hypothetical protein
MSVSEAEALPPVLAEAGSTHPKVALANMAALRARRTARDMKGSL